MTVSNPHQKDDLVNTWDSVAKSYNAADYWAAPENWANLEVLLSHIGEPKGKRILEMGCGSGMTSKALAERGAWCALLDISPESLKVAVGCFTSTGLPPPECYQTDALDNTIPSDQYDIVWNGGVIEHFTDDGKELLTRQMLRLARPGGKVIILVPNAWCWPFQLAQTWMKWKGTWPYGFEDDMSPRRLNRMCRRMGLTNVEAYAFNPVAGWHWLPHMSGVTRRLGVNTLKYHMRRCWMGNVSVLVIRK